MIPLSLFLEIHAMTKYLIVHKTFSCEIKIDRIIFVLTAYFAHGVWYRIIHVVNINVVSQLPFHLPQLFYQPSYV